MIQDLLTGWSSLIREEKDYREAGEQYSGETPEVFASEAIRRRVEVTGDHYRFNLIATVIDVPMRKLKLRQVTVPDDQEASTLIQKIWDANDLDIWFPILVRRTLMYGDAYLSVWPVVDQPVISPEGTPEPAPDPQLIDAGVELVVHDPTDTRIIYDQETQRRKVYAITRWQADDDGRWRVNLIYPTAIERWVLRLDRDGMHPEDWEQYLEPDQSIDSWLLPNDTGEIPFFHFRTDAPYGQGVAANGYGCQNALTKMLVTQINTADSQGWPERYRLTDAGAELDNSGDTPDWIDDADAVATPSVVDQQAGVGSNRRSGPGTMQTFTGTKAVGEFAAADPATLLTPAQFYIRLMGQLTMTPLHYMDPTGDIPSGESLRVRNEPLNERVDWLKTILTASIRETFRYVLSLVSIIPTTLDVQWHPITQASTTDDWMAVGAKQAAGVPQDQTLIEAGYPSDQVSTWLDSNAEAMDLTRRVGHLNDIGDALTKLGSAVTLGVLDADAVQSIVERLLPQAAPETDPPIA